MGGDPIQGYSVVRAPVLGGYGIGSAVPVDGAGRYGRCHRQRSPADEAVRPFICWVWPASDCRVPSPVVALTRRELG